MPQELRTCCFVHTFYACGHESDSPFILHTSNCGASLFSSISCPGFEDVINERILKEECRECRNISRAKIDSSKAEKMTDNKAMKVFTPSAKSVSVEKALADHALFRRHQKRSQKSEAAKFEVETKVITEASCLLVPKDTEGKMDADGKKAKLTSLGGEKWQMVKDDELPGAVDGLDFEEDMVMV